MKAAIIDLIGGAPKIEEASYPNSENGGILMDVVAVALNPVDIAIANGKFYAGHPALPFIPALEAVGRISSNRLVYAQGDGYGISRNGFLAQQVEVSESILIDIPIGSDPGVAVALGTAGLAGWLSVIWRASVGENDVVVVIGATGAVGKIALQAASFAGARKVIAVGRNQKRLDSDDVIASSKVLINEDLATNVLKAAGEPPTVVIDMTWGAPLASLLPILAGGARIVQVGASASAEATLMSSVFRGKQLNLMGYSNFGVPRNILVSNYKQIVELANEGKLQVAIKRFGYMDIETAWQSAVNGDAKVVIEMEKPK